MRYPVLLIRIGSAGLVLAARWSHDGRAPSRGATAILEVERGEWKHDDSEHAVPEQHESPPVLGPAEGPGDFFKRHLEDEFSGRFGRSWDELHPAHQRVVTRERYVMCRSELFDQAGAWAELEQFDVLDVCDDPLDLPEIPEKTSKAVTVQFTLRCGEQTRSATDIVHAIQAGGRWAWILPVSAYRAYEAGSCPGGVVATAPAPREADEPTRTAPAAAS